jgi:uncharacterized repeat protein (TIGR03837 family)
MEPHASPDPRPPSLAPRATAQGPSLRWYVFCRVIDNLGDIGVCWRLCANLAQRGQRVHLWIDQPDALSWMVPGALEGRVPGIEVLHWDTAVPCAGTSAQDDAGGDREGDAGAVVDVWVESFGCEPPVQLIAALAKRLRAGVQAPVWINLEYLSAEPFVKRSHGLPSMVNSGPLRGLGKWFFYPGFTARTGGLLREDDLLQRQARFDPLAWLSSLPLALEGPPASMEGDRRKVSLFCYEPKGLSAVLQGAGQDAQASNWWVTTGRAAAAVAAAQAQHGPPGAACQLHALPALTQHDFDHLLWACDLNFVRGEDSLVRALWSGKPFVWHIYPQDDDAHHTKLNAFLDWLQAPESLRAFHHAWNGMGSVPTRWPGWAVVDSWQACVQAARQRLLAQPDLATQLIGFVVEKR